MFPIKYSDNPKIHKVEKVALWTVVGLVGVTAFVLLFGLLVQFLWNVTLVEMFDFPALTLWQAIGLFVLAKLFFGFGTGAQQNKKSKHKRRREKYADLGETFGAQPFKDYWQQEGKAAYAAFKEAKQSEQND